MEITFEGKRKVIAHVDGLKIITDSSIEAGGNGEGVSPFVLFLCSLGCCAGVYVRAFFNKHNLNSDNVRMYQDFDFFENGNLKKSILDIHVGEDFPMEKENALLANVKACKVKKHTDPNIEFEINIIPD